MKRSTFDVRGSMLALVLAGLVATPAHGEPPAPGAGSGSGSGSAPSASDYAGVEVCRDCHPTAWRVWFASRHARSTVTLQTELAQAIARREAVGRPAARTERPQTDPFCLTCHGTAADAVPTPPADAPGFHPTEGVTCEACHGPRAKHVAWAQREQQRQAAAGGEASAADSKATGSGKAGAAGKDHPAHVPPQPRACLDCHHDKPSHRHDLHVPYDEAKFKEAIKHGREPEPPKGTAGGSTGK